MIAIIDYSLGNLYSVKRSLDFLGMESCITGDAKTIARADKLILPGVGAFRDAIEKLEERNLIPVIKERAAAGVPLLGICLGMQLLFEKSYEYGEYEGLKLIPGEIRPIEADLTIPLKVPQIGWNSLNILHECPLTKYISEGDYVYFVHSYYAKNAGDAVITTSDYGVQVPGIVQNNSVYGCQFHPEKSGGVGLNILRAFDEL